MLIASVVSELEQSQEGPDSPISESESESDSMRGNTCFSVYVSIFKVCHI